MTDIALTQYSYCNSVLQCLYHSPPFREHVLNFPIRTPLDQLKSHVVEDVVPEPIPTTPSSSLAQMLSPSKNKATTPASPQKPKPLTTIASQVQPPGKEESKDSPEYKKRMALINGPIINMDYANSDKYGMSESLFTSVKDLFESVAGHNSRTGVVSPHKVLEILRRDFAEFRTLIHQDAHEFLNNLLNQVVVNVEQYSKQLEMENSGSGSSVSGTASDSDDSSLGPTDQSPVKRMLPDTKWIHDLFEGTMTSETRCMTCEHTSFRDEAFLDLSVDLDVYSSVTSCLLRFSEEEMLCERNKFHCDRCGGLQEAEKRMRLKRLPKILALHLKRFKFTDDMQRMQKLFHHVSYPYYLRLLNTTDSSEESDKLYELYAIVVHIGGGAYHGHYVSIVKTQEHGWLLFDDENVEPVDKSFVCEFFGGEQNLACAYVLFYHETTAEAMYREQEMEGRLNLASDQRPNVAQTKTNGTTQIPVPISTGPDVENDFPYLDRSATAPLSPSATIQSGPSTSIQNALEQVVTSPMLPFLNRKKSGTLSRKDVERFERERKEHERELERLAKDRQKNEDSYLTAGGRTSLSTDSRTSQNMTNLEVGEEPRDLTLTPKENGSNKFSLTNSLQRFKVTSKSLRGKPSFMIPNAKETPIPTPSTTSSNRLSNPSSNNGPAPTSTSNPAATQFHFQPSPPTGVPFQYPGNSPLLTNDAHGGQFRLSGASSQGSASISDPPGASSRSSPPPSHAPESFPAREENIKKEKGKRSLWGLGRKKTGPPSHPFGEGLRGMGMQS